jgi:hypothetical protein
MPGPNRIGTIEMKPGLYPRFADDNIHFEFFMLSGDPTIFSIQYGLNSPSDGPYTVGDLTGLEGVDWLADEKTYDYGVIKVSEDALTSGVKASALFKFAARDLKLDRDTGASNYSQLQTRPEYYFRVDVQKP